MLVDVSADSELWSSWMRVFNRYPVRFAGLQRSLGNALSKMHQAAVAQYVESISLHSRPHDERHLVAVCLDAFRASADLPHRQALWTAAKRRWEQWDFDADEQEGSLFEISWSALDYVVVGYFVECAVAPQRNERISSILSEIGAIDRKWFRSFTAFLTARNRLLSRLQPIAHANAAIDDNLQWLSTTRQYELDSDRTDYAAKKYWIKAKAPVRSLGDQAQVAPP